MEELYDVKAAKEYILKQFKEQGDFDFVDEKTFEDMVETVMALDQEYLNKVSDTDGFYDDDEAYEFMFGKMKEKFEDYQMYMMRLVEDYLDYNEDYLNSIGAIEWE